MQWRRQLGDWGIAHEWVENNEHDGIAILYADTRAEVEAFTRLLQNRRQALMGDEAQDLFVSPCVKGVNAITVAYHQVDNTLSMLTDYMRGAEGERRYYMPLDWEENLIRDVRAGNARGMARTLSLLEAENTRIFGGEDALKPLSVCLLGVLTRIAEETGADKGALLPAADFSFAAASGRASFETVRGALTLMCESRAERLNAFVPEQAGKIREYMREHYCEYLLTQQVAAERFGMTPSSMSRLYKSAFGTNFADDLRDLRIARAKTLIAAGALTLPEIARSVGYENDLTFKRAFKRCELVSPREYRQTVEKPR